MPEGRLDDVLEEMLLELHEQLVALRRILGDRLIGASLTQFYRVDSRYHVLLEELRSGHYVPTTADPGPPSDEEPPAC